MITIEDIKKWAKPHPSHKLRGRGGKQTRFGNSWEMYKVIPVDEKGDAIKLKLAGSYFLIGFFHDPFINFYDDTSYVIVEYAKTGKIFKLRSMIKADFEIDQIQKKLKTKSIEDFVEGSWSRLSDDLAEKLDRLRCFFNKNLNPDKLLLEKKIELVEKHLLSGSIRRKLKIETGKRQEIIIRY